MKALKDIISCFTQTPTHTKKQWKLKLIHEWNSIVGNLSDKICIYKIYNDVIVVGVFDVSWIQELYMLSELIKQKINNALDTPHIKTLRFQYVAKKKKQNKQINQTITENTSSILLTMNEQNALNQIKDPELYQALKRLLVKCQQ